MQDRQKSFIYWAILTIFFAVSGTIGYDFIFNLMGSRGISWVIVGFVNGLAVFLLYKAMFSQTDKER